jgi:hypothetical protein
VRDEEETTNTYPSLSHSLTNFLFQSDNELIQGGKAYPIKLSFIRCVGILAERRIAFLDKVVEVKILNIEI